MEDGREGQEVDVTFDSDGRMTASRKWRDGRVARRLTQAVEGAMKDTTFAFSGGFLFCVTWYVLARCCGDAPLFYAGFVFVCLLVLRLTFWFAWPGIVGVENSLKPHWWKWGAGIENRRVEWVAPITERVRLSGYLAVLSLVTYQSLKTAGADGLWVLSSYMIMMTFMPLIDSWCRRRASRSVPVEASH